MGISIELIAYDKTDIEKYIEKYPKTKFIFDKCGKFLGEKYIVLNNEYIESNSPYYQISLGLALIVVKEKEINLEYEDELWEIKDEMINEFENLKRSNKFLPNYVDFREE